MYTKYKMYIYWAVGVTYSLVSTVRPVPWLSSLEFDL